MDELLADAVLAKVEMERKLSMVKAWEENENLKRNLAEAEAKLEEAPKLREQEQKTADVSAKRLSKAIESLLGELAGSYLCSPFSSRI